MKIYYYKQQNFGEQLNPWLWKKLLPGIFTEKKADEYYDKLYAKQEFFKEDWGNGLFNN